MPPHRPTIAIITDWLANNYTDPIVDEATHTAHEGGANVVWLVDRPTQDELLEERPLVFDLAGPLNVDAVLLLSFGHAVDAASAIAYCERFKPLPMCSITIPWTEHPRVLIENSRGMRDAVTHLIEVHERRRIAFLRGPLSSPEAQARFAAYEQALAAHGIPFDPALLIEGDFSHFSGLHGMRAFLERRTPIDAVVCANDGMAFGALQELQARGIRVPGDLSIVGFDDIATGHFIQPALTTVRQPTRKQARAAVEILFAQLAGKAVPLETVIDSELVIRHSCGCSEQAELERAVGASMVPPPQAGSEVALWAEQLGAALEKDLFLETRRSFLSKLHEIIENLMTHERDVKAVHPALTAVRRHLAGMSLAETQARIGASLLDKARVAVGIAGERTHGAQCVRLEEMSYKLNGVNRTINKMVSLPSLTDAVAAQLPWLGIPSLYLCLYDIAPGSPLQSRLVLAVKQQRRIDLPAGGQVFPSDLLLPDGYLSPDVISTYIACSLDREGRSLGYVVFERGPLDGMAYDVITEQIGAALTRIHTLEQLVHEAGRRQTADRERLEKEMRIAREIQTGILPRSVLAEGLEIAAVMVPATEIGGDYYDVIPVPPHGCWLGIGDVAGHGLPTGLVMLMLQSVVSGLARSDPQQKPREMLSVVNRVLFENVRERLAQDEHVTLTLLHVDAKGRLAFAGAHEDILLYRAKARAIEWMTTPGTWVAARPDIESVTVDSGGALDEGDLMVLYTDGATEARNAEGEMFGIERLGAELARVACEPVSSIRDALMAAIKSWMVVQEDDITLVVVRRQHLP